MFFKVRGDIPAIIRNDGKLYEGDLKAYFNILFYRSQGLQNPYHNFRHTCHVLMLCYEACLYHRGSLSPREMRNLLIAALFHDFNHTGGKGSDLHNIVLALEAFGRYIQPEDTGDDRQNYDQIRWLIRMTEYPYRVPSERLSFLGQIIRDADMGQVLSVAWIQQVVFGLAEEWGVAPLEVLRLQVPFLEKLAFHTEWGQATFSPEIIQEKVAEAKELLELLATELVPLTR